MGLVLFLMRLAAVSLSQVGSTSRQSTLVGAGRKDLSMSIHKRASTGDHSKLNGRRCLRKSVLVVGERYAVISDVCCASSLARLCVGQRCRHQRCLLCGTAGPSSCVGTEVALT